MKVIGLTGGVGSGKSFAARLLKEEFHALLLISDDLGHIAMETGSVGYHRIVKRFGKEILSEDESIDREALAAVIFRDEDARRDLNGIIHPIVLEYIRSYIEERKSQKGIIILESAILFESGCDKYCDEVWYVRVSKEIRKKRLAQNRGYTEEKTESIMDKQLSEAEFLKRCQVVLNNNGTLEELLLQIRQKKKDYVKSWALIADDQEINRVILKKGLQQHYQILEASDGEEVISFLQEGIVPELLLLDMLMPNKDGMEVLQYIQNHGLEDRILVYIITADEEEIERIHSQGFLVKGLLQKPFDMEKIKNTLL